MTLLLFLTCFFITLLVAQTSVILPVEILFSPHLLLWLGGLVAFVAFSWLIGGE